MNCDSEVTVSNVLPPEPEVDPRPAAPLADAEPLPAAPSAPAPWPDKPWLTIWVAPRKTMRAILNSNPTRHVILLALLAGVAEGIDRAAGRSMGDTMSAPVALLVGLILGAASGLIGLYIGGALYRWTGSFFGGVATSEETRSAVAWATLPTVVSVALLIPELLLYGGEVFRSETPRMDANPLPVLFFAVLQVVLSLWSLFLLVKTVSEAHRINAWRGLIAVALPTIVVAVLLGGCAILSQGFYIGP
jgi:hypothetical protein